MRLNRYLLEETQDTIVFADIDSTLINSTTRVWVVKNDKRERVIGPDEINSYQQKEGETIDDSELKDAKHFAETATPIKNVVKEVNDLAQQGVHVILLTARPTFDNMSLYKKTLKKCGIMLDKMKLVMAGNKIFLNKLSKEIIPATKKKYAQQFIRLGKYKKAIIYDDYIEVCKEFLSLQGTYKDIEFEANHVQKNGEIRKYEIWPLYTSRG